jgi:malate dehydrogenase (quinone)
LVTAADHSMVALLGASPGASTAVFIAISLLERCFKSALTENGWLPKLKEMIPSYGESLIENAELCRRVRAETAAVLHLENIGSSGSAKIGDDRAAGIDNTAERALGSR